MKRKISKSDKFPIYRHTSKINGKTISRDIVDFSDISIIIAYESKKINFKSFLKLIKSGKIHEPCTITTAMIFAMKQKLI